MKTLMLWTISILYCVLIQLLFRATDNNFSVAYIGGILGLKLIMVTSRYLGINMKEV